MTPEELKPLEEKQLSRQLPETRCWHRRFGSL
jgi:hypothetical protein